MALCLWIGLFLSFFQCPVLSRPSKQKCGQRLHGTHGTIESPNYPHKYDSDLKCEWIIVAPEGQVVQLTFKDFDVESFIGECDIDRVHIRDGQNDTSASLGKILCGQTIPEMITSTGRYMKITFISDYTSFSGRGFSADYVTIPVEGGRSCVTNACGGIIESTACQIQSPGYPSSFQSSLDCSWLVKAPHESHVISFRFLDLDLNAANSLCKNNNVTIYDGGNIHAPVIHESLCDIMHNRLDDRPLISTGPIVFMRFRTSQALTRHGLVNGFNARFQVLDSDGNSVESSSSPSSSSTPTPSTSASVTTTTAQTTTSTSTPPTTTTTTEKASTTTRKVQSSTTEKTTTTLKKDSEDESDNSEKVTTSVQETTKPVEASPIVFMRFRTSQALTRHGLVNGFNARFQVLDSDGNSVESSSSPSSSSTPTPSTSAPVTTTTAHTTTSTSTPPTTTTTTEKASTTTRKVQSSTTKKTTTTLKKDSEDESGNSEKVTTSVQETTKPVEATAISGLVIGIIVVVAVIVLAILLMVAFKHWKK